MNPMLVKQCSNCCLKGIQFFPRIFHMMKYHILLGKLISQRIASGIHSYVKLRCIVGIIHAAEFPLVVYIKIALDLFMFPCHGAFLGIKILLVFHCDSLLLASVNL